MATEELFWGCRSPGPSPPPWEPRRVKEKGPSGEAAPNGSQRGDRIAGQLAPQVREGRGGGVWREGMNEEMSGPVLPSLQTQAPEIWESIFYCFIKSH